MPDPVTDPSADDLAELRKSIGRAVWDPGKVLARGDNYEENLADWQTRAVWSVVEPLLAEADRLRRVEAAAREYREAHIAVDSRQVWDDESWKVASERLNAADGALRALLAGSGTPTDDCNIGGGTSTPNDANAILHQADGWLSLRCGFCGHWSKGQFTKDQVAEWLRVHRNAMLGPNEGHTSTESTCPHPCGTPMEGSGTPTETDDQPSVCPGSGQERVISPGGYDPPGPQGMCPVCEQIVPLDDGIVEDHPAGTPDPAHTEADDTTTRWRRLAGAWLDGSLTAESVLDAVAGGHSEEATTEDGR